MTTTETGASQAYQDGFAYGCDSGLIILGAEGEHPLMQLSVPVPGPAAERSDWLHGLANGLKYAAQTTHAGGYHPLSGRNWNQDAGRRAWAQSMNRSKPRWQLRGEPGTWVWNFWNFGTWQGWVTVKADGFHWRTTDYDTGQEIHSGVTTSVYAAYQSCERNEPTEPPRAAPSADDKAAR